jgi:hypothetical protein
MDTIPEKATMYIWPKKPFNIEYLIFILGGQQIRTNKEISMNLRCICTSDFRIYSTTKEQDLAARANHRENTQYNPRFKTPLLEERLKKYDLFIPDIEITFCTREQDYHSDEPLKVQKIIDAARHLMCIGMDVLCVPGTSIEENQYVASKSIAEKMKIINPLTIKI